MFRILRRSGSALGNDNNWAPASPSITPPYRYGPQPPEVIGTYVRVRLCFVTSARVPAGTIARTCIDRRSGAISPRRNAPSPRVIGPVFSKISRARIDTYCTRDRVRRLGYGNYRPPQTAFFPPCAERAEPPGSTEHRRHLLGVYLSDLSRLTCSIVLQRVGGVR